MDLSSMLPDPDKKDDGFYEIALHKHKDLDSRLLDAHIASMKHSQMHDYGRKLRVVVIPSAFGLPGSLNPYGLNVPGLERSMQVADEVVIRERRVDPNLEHVIKGMTGLRPISGTV